VRPVAAPVQAVIPLFAALHTVTAVRPVAAPVQAVIPLFAALHTVTVLQIL